MVFSLQVDLEVQFAPGTPGSSAVFGPQSVLWHRDLLSYPHLPLYPGLSTPNYSPMEQGTAFSSILSHHYVLAVLTMQCLKIQKPEV